MDLAILGLFFVLLCVVYHYNYQKEGPFKMEVYMQKKRFQIIAITMFSLQLAKSMLIVLGTLYHVAYFHYDLLPSSCVMSYCLM